LLLLSLLYILSPAFCEETTPHEGRTVQPLVECNSAQIWEYFENEVQSPENVKYIKNITEIDSYGVDEKFIRYFNYLPFREDTPQLLKKDKGTINITWTEKYTVNDTKFDFQESQIPSINNSLLYGYFPET